MTKILILGGYGYTGRLLARHLLEQSKAQIILAGRSLEKAQTSPTNSIPTSRASV